MLGFEGVVVAYDTACLRPVLGSGSSPMRQMAERREVLFHIQYVGVCVHTLQHQVKLAVHGSVSCDQLK